MGQAWVLFADLCWSVCWFGLAGQQVCWLVWGGSMEAEQLGWSDKAVGSIGVRSMAVCVFIL
jgi:hypothetical protein